jgi:hypothetical protein
MLKRDGTLGQQWYFTAVDDGNGGYGFKISNGLSGNKTWLSLPFTNGTPGMQSSSSGTLWDIQINPGAGRPNPDNYYQDVHNLEVTSSSSVSSASSMITVTSMPTNTPTNTPTITNTNSASLAPGAIAGIVVGIAVFVVVAAIGAYFCISKRKQKKVAGNEANTTPELIGVSKTKNAHVYKPVELGSDPVVHIAQERGFQELRHEL